MIGTHQIPRLTNTILAFMLFWPCNSKAGIRPPRTGHTRPSFTMVFLCPPKTLTALCRLYSVMVGCVFEQPLKRLAGSCIGRSNLKSHSTAQRLDPKGGGYSLYTGVRAMSQNNSIPKSGQNQPKNLADIHQAFANLCFNYGMLGRQISAERNHEALEEIITDCKDLIGIVETMRLQGGVK